jgi:hypothetical protein
MREIRLILRLPRSRKHTRAAITPQPPNSFNSFNSLNTMPSPEPPPHTSAICFKNDEKNAIFSKGGFFTRKHEQIIKRSTLITFKLAKISAFSGFYENSLLKASRASFFLKIGVSH